MTPFASHHQLKGKAYYLGQRIDLKTFEKSARLATSPLVVSAGADGVAVLFRYGVAVFFGLDETEEEIFLGRLQPFVTVPVSHRETEQVDLTLSTSGNDAGAITLDEFDLPRLQVVADVLAKSAVLSHYEAVLAKTFERIEPLSTRLGHGGRFTHRSRDLLKYIGDVLVIEGKMVGRVEVSEKPELLWEEPRYERLYARLADEYELQERHLALERKLSLVSRTAETMLELLQNKRSLRVEWYIVILIVVEILLTLYEMWRPHGA